MPLAEEACAFLAQAADDCSLRLENNLSQVFLHGTCPIVDQQTATMEHGVSIAISSSWLQVWEERSCRNLMHQQALGMQASPCFGEPVGNVTGLLHGWQMHLGTHFFRWQTDWEAG